MYIYQNLTLGAVNMRKIGKNFIFILGIICIMAGIFGLSYTYHIDHRSADSLSAYCRIDFQSSFTETGKLEGAVLSLWDFRYDGAKFLPQAVLYTDGDAWEMSAAVKQISPQEREAAQDPETSAVNDEHPYQYENKLRDPSTYTKEEIERITHFGSSENRQNASGTPMFFFDWLYSAQSRKIIEEHIIRTTFLGKSTRIHERIWTPLKNVEKKILENAANSEIKEFIDNLRSADAYYWREIAGTSRKSFHSYGIALDVLPKRLGGKAIYWGWEKDRLGDKWMMIPLEKRWTPPSAVREIFESEGFIWGGYWVIFDNMHFEYHPELIYN